MPLAEERTAEARHLQTCLNELVGMLALSALWSGSAPRVMMTATVDGLVKLQRLDQMLIRLGAPIDGAPQELVRRGPGAAPGAVLRSASFRIGIREEIGVLVACSQRADFPRPTEALLLQVAASQLAVGLQEARRAAEQERTAMELERRVLERTAEAERRAREVEAAQASLLTTRDELAHVMRVTALGEMAASIAHEVNQPLCAVVVNGDACLRWLREQPPQLGEARTAVERILRDAQRATEVITRVRAFVGRGGVSRVALDVCDVLQDVALLIGDKARREGVSLEVAVARGLPPVPADRVQLQQVLLNLAINAIEAMRAIEERPRVLRLAVSANPPDAVLVAVRDSGAGLGAAQRERAFDAFHTTKPGGMGMGLAISRSIVEAHGGRLWATPNDDAGETFQFTLPVSSA